MIIREIKNNELNDLLKLYKYLDDDIQRKSEEKVEETFKSLLENECFTCFVVEIEKRIVASCILIVVPNLTRGCRPYSFIENVVTDVNFRNHGIGKALVSHVLDYSFRLNCYKIMLLANTNSEGVHRFYRKCGFDSVSKTGFIVRYFPQKEEHDDEGK